RLSRVPAGAAPRTDPAARRRRDAHLLRHASDVGAAGEVARRNLARLRCEGQHRAVARALKRVSALEFCAKHAISLTDPKRYLMVRTSAKAECALCGTRDTVAYPGRSGRSNTDRSVSASGRLRTVATDCYRPRADIEI